MNPEPDGCSNGFWMPTFVVDAGIPFDRDLLMAKMRAEGVDARVFFWPLSSTPAGGKKAFQQPYLSEEIYLRALNLPSYHDMKAEDTSFVAAIITSYLLG